MRSVLINMRVSCILGRWNIMTQPAACEQTGQVLQDIILRQLPARLRDCHCAWKMTRHKMLRLYLGQRRGLCCAPWRGRGAAGAEPATRGWVDRTWDFAAENDAPAHFSDLGDRDG